MGQTEHSKARLPRVEKQWPLSSGHGLDDGASLRNRLCLGSKPLPQCPRTSLLSHFGSPCLARCLLLSPCVWARQEERGKRSFSGLRLRLDLCELSKAPAALPLKCHSQIHAQYLGEFAVCVLLPPLCISHSPRQLAATHNLIL